jgi:hypothetical protein
MTPVVSDFRASCPDASAIILRSTGALTVFGSPRMHWLRFKARMSRSIDSVLAICVMIVTTRYGCDRHPARPQEQAKTRTVIAFRAIRDFESVTKGSLRRIGGGHIKACQCFNWCGADDGRVTFL